MRGLFLSTRQVGHTVNATGYGHLQSERGGTFPAGLRKLPSLPLPLKAARCRLSPEAGRHPLPLRSDRYHQ